MKKIIYSLVIMIAAGSLFTSCIEPVEPAGIYDLREAKARYYDALSKLRAADAVKVEAEADKIKAEAEFQRAMVENQNLLNEYQRLVNEAKALDNEEEAAKWELELEKLLKEREILRVQWEQQLAEANEALRQALSKIAMAALDLTDAEKKALNDAIADYEKALADYNAAKEAVTAAEAALWAAQYDMENVCDEDGLFFPNYGDYIRTGMDWGEYYESAIALAELYAAFYAAEYEEMANNTDLAKWAEELEGLKEDLTMAKYNRYQVTKDSVEYMMNVYHDGVHAYEMAVQAWIEDNPAVAKPTEPKEPKEKDFPAKNYLADSIAFPVLDYTAPDQAFDKLRSLLSSYTTVNTLVGDTTNFVIVEDATEKTITLVANQQMKDFVLGTETSTVGSQKLTYYDKATEKNVTKKADYGLNGALSTLKRALVLSHSTATKEDAEKAAKAALDKWTADRDSIIALYDAKAAKKNVAEAYEPLATAMKALKDAKDDATTGEGALAKAAEEIVDILNGIIPHTDFSTPDTTALVKAVVEFAKTRQAYLEYTPYKNNVERDNKNLFYYVYSTSPDVLVDSIAFTDLTVDLLRKKPSYSYAPKDATPFYEDYNGGASGEGAFINIIEQLLGTTAAAHIDAVSAVDINEFNNAAFYNAYKYVAGTPAEIQTAAGDKYVPKAITDAIAAVQAAVAELNKLWDRFWAEDLGATADADGKVTIPVLDDKYNPKTYTMESFTKPYNVIVFDAGKVKWTAAMGAILGSVDPNKGLNDGSDLEAGGYVSGSAIFEGTNGTTDFFKWAQANDEWVNFDSSETIDAIEAWIGDVVAAFEKDVKDAEDAAAKAYKKAVENYDKAKKTYDENKAKYDAYQAALAAFVGYKEDGKTLNPIVATIGTPDANYKAAGVKQTETGIYEWTGEWDLAGTQKELAEKYIPGYPVKLAKWHTDAVKIDHEIIHLEAIIKELEDAYITAAGIYYDETDYIDFYGFNVEEYFEDFLEYLAGEVEMYTALASIYEDALAKWNAGYDASQINLEILQDELALAEAKLADAEIKLQVAEEHYQKVLAAILG